jgi:ATP-dependent Clp protease protease subunit
MAKYHTTTKEASMSENNNQSRILILSDEINDETVENLIKTITEINAYDDAQEKRVVDYERKPIQFIINSPGGECYAGFALISTMDRSKTPIHTYGYGRIMSMALLVFVAGHKRYTDTFTSFMYHGVHYGNWGTLEDHREYTPHVEGLQRMYDDYLLSKSKFTEEELDAVKKVKGNLYFFGSEAVFRGVADDLIEKGEKANE